MKTYTAQDINLIVRKLRVPESVITGLRQAGEEDDANLAESYNLALDDVEREVSRE